MESTRQQKVSRLVHKEMGSILQRENNNLLPGKLITVTMTRISPDLGLAKVYVSIFPGSSLKDDLKSLESANKHLRHELGKKVGKQLRIVPEIRFYPDDSLDYVEKIDNLLK